MARYNVHFSGYYGYDVEVEAESEEQARKLATPIFENTDESEFIFVPNGSDIWEIK